MAKRPTQDAWRAACQRWEADPTETYESIGQAVGVSREAVRKRAGKDGWKRPTNLREISEKAHVQADAHAAKLTQVDRATSKSTEQAAVDKRAELLHRHRTDWSEHRSLFTLQSIAEDFEAGKRAKISAEMIALRQKAERDAYGMEAGKGGDSLPTVTVKDYTGRSLTDLELASKMAYFVDVARRRGEQSDR